MQNNIVAGEVIFKVLKKWNIELPRDPGNPIPGYRPKGTENESPRRAPSSIVHTAPRAETTQKPISWCSRHSMGSVQKRDIVRPWEGMEQ